MAPAPVPFSSEGAPKFLRQGPLYLLPITRVSGPELVPDFPLRNSPLSFSETSPQPKVSVLGIRHPGVQ